MEDRSSQNGSNGRVAQREDKLWEILHGVGGGFLEVLRLAVPLIFVQFPWANGSSLELRHLSHEREITSRKLLPATGVVWALRAQSWKKSPKLSSWGLSAPGPKKSKTESEKSQKRLFFNYFGSFSTPFSTCWAPGTHFRTLFSSLGPKGPNDPCSSSMDSQELPQFCFRKNFRRRPPGLIQHELSLLLLVPGAAGAPALQLHLERPCASLEDASMLLRREGGFLKREGGFLRRGRGFLRSFA